MMSLGKQWKKRKAIFGTNILMTVKRETVDYCREGSIRKNYPIPTPTPTPREAKQEIYQKMPNKRARELKRAYHLLIVILYQLLFILSSLYYI